jgi:hypothetical protein
MSSHFELLFILSTVYCMLSTAYSTHILLLFRTKHQALCTKNSRTNTMTSFPGGMASRTRVAMSRSCRKTPKWLAFRDWKKHPKPPGLSPNRDQYSIFPYPFLCATVGLSNRVFSFRSQGQKSNAYLFLFRTKHQALCTKNSRTNTKTSFPGGMAAVLGGHVLVMSQNAQRTCIQRLKKTP